MLASPERVRISRLQPADDGRNGSLVDGVQEGRQLGEERPAQEQAEDSQSDADDGDGQRRH